MHKYIFILIKIHTYYYNTIIFRNANTNIESNYYKLTKYDDHYHRHAINHHMVSYITL